MHRNTAISMEMYAHNQNTKPLRVNKQFTQCLLTNENRPKNRIGYQYFGISFDETVIFNENLYKAECI